MKKLLILLNFIFILNLFAKEEYYLKYKLINANEKIGELKASKIKTKDNTYKYTTSMSLEYKYMFMDFKYFYKEEVYEKNNQILSLKVIEKEKHKKSKSTAINKNGFLVYNNGEKIDLSKIDYKPYKFTIDVKNLPLGEFKNKSFDIFTGKEINQITQIKKYRNSFFLIKTIGNYDEEDIKIVNKRGFVTEIRSEAFTAILVEIK